MSASLRHRVSCQRRPRAVVIGVLTLGLLASAGIAWQPTAQRPAESRWLGADGDPLPFSTDEQLLEFLRTANIVTAAPIGQGINESLKLLLEKDDVRAHAIFRSVDLVLEERRHSRRGMPGFRDSYAFEPAAYELNRILGVDRIPPAVERSYEGNPGSAQIWVENAIDETTRRKRDLDTVGRQERERQLADRLILDALIYNFDRNEGNLVYDPGGNLWLIDHTRSFAPDPRLPNKASITRCDSQLWEKLTAFDRQRVENALEPYLTRREVKQLFVRWKALVRHLRQEIEKHGEGEVLLERRTD